MTPFLFALVFALGALAVIWVGLGFVGGQLIALAATLLIAAVYGLGFLELRHFRRATRGLAEQLRSPPTNQDTLTGWLAGLPAALRGAVARRIDGEPVALPGPVLTPYLTGLLVMMGLLGTFIGMIVTLRGAVTALEGGSELHAIRSALAAPIQGMSLAFGTSIAGVAASAMLGLAAVLSRRDRLLATRELDGLIQQGLRPLSSKYQRQEAYRALQQQAGAFPAVVESLNALASRMETMGDQLGNALTANQQRFHDDINGHYQALARSVSDTLGHSLAQSGRLAAESARPVMEQALERLNQQVERTHQRLGEITDSRLAGLAERFQATTEQAAEHWRAGLTEQHAASDRLAESVHASLQTHNDQFQRHGEQLLTHTRAHHEALHASSAQYLQQLGERFERTTEQASEHWRTGLQAQQHTSERLADTVATSLARQSEQFQQHSDALLKQVREQQQHLHHTSEQHLATLAERFQASTEQASESWRAGLNEQQRGGSALISEISTALNGHNEQFQRTASELLDGQRSGLDTLVTQVGDALSRLRDQEAQRATAAGERLADLEHTVADHLAALGTALEAPMTRLIETASETPKAAAEVIAKLRSEITRNSERDNELLEERRRIMAELDTLLSAQRDAAGAQREAIETLIRDASRVLTDTGQAFSTRIDEQAGKLDQVAAEVTGSAHEVASLSDAFATAVQVFSDANDKLVENLQSIETALQQSSTRSDEQLAYYVEQAREVIDLSMTSQKDVLDTLGALRQSEPPADGAR
ncbi:DUF802 domain-containing protein [Alcanivorax sp. N3-2A]|nr:DUF802 domain-containing protein [Alcanivorax sp. N3-2A]|tara:strand:+ start:54299 stop:56596 length:2298 start_codon:yes stop_codon:yes gene_type:complete